MIANDILWSPKGLQEVIGRTVARNSFGQHWTPLIAPTGGGKGTCMDAAQPHLARGYQILYPTKATIVH